MMRQGEQQIKLIAINSSYPMLRKICFAIAVNNTYIDYIRHQYNVLLHSMNIYIYRSCTESAYEISSFTISLLLLLFLLLHSFSSVHVLQVEPCLLSLTVHSVSFV